MKKKIITLIIAGTLTVGVVGGTFAWFTASDNIANTFNTTGLDQRDGSDIEVHENANGKTDTTEDQTFDKKVVPGVDMQKEVWVKNVDEYDQFIRTTVTKGFTDASFNSDFILVDYNENQILRIVDKTAENIEYKDKDGNVVTDYAGKWMEGLDGNFYYIGKVVGGDVTPNIINKVTLSKDAGNSYQEKEFKVTIDAKGVQAAGNACADEFAGAGATIINALESLQ